MQCLFSGDHALDTVPPRSSFPLSPFAPARDACSSARPSVLGFAEIAEPGVLCESRYSYSCLHTEDAWLHCEALVAIIHVHTSNVSDIMFR